MESIGSTMGNKNISLAKNLNANQIVNVDYLKNVDLNQLLPKYPADISISINRNYPHI